MFIYTLVTNAHSKELEQKNEKLLPLKTVFKLRFGVLLSLRHISVLEITIASAIFDTNRIYFKGPFFECFDTKFNVRK
jgi:hypothetical protein